MRQLTHNQGTFVYAPDVAAYIATFGGIIDVSNDIESGEVHRRVNGVSTVTLNLTNKFGKYDRVIARMNRIVVFLKRTSYLQVFSGYVVQSPYETIVPRAVAVMAECTLKRLNHTYWDLYAPESQALLPLSNQAASRLPDGGAAASVFKIMTSVGQWDPNQILLQKIPRGFLEHAARVATKITGDLEGDPIFQESLKQFHDLLSAGGWDGQSGPTYQGIPNPNVASTGTGGTANSGNKKAGGGGGGVTPASTNPLQVFPVAGKFKTYANSDFGISEAGSGIPGLKYHCGIDLICPEGTPLVAPYDGRIVSGYEGSGGYHCFIYDSGGSYVVYLHMNGPGINGKVKAGEVIGHVGHSGSASNGVNHLHFEWHPAGGAPAGWPAGSNGQVAIAEPWDPAPSSAVNPFPVLRAAQTGDSLQSVLANMPASSQGGTGGGPGGTSQSPAFNVFFGYPAFDAQTAFLVGDRSWINDVPIFGVVNDLMNASLRNFQSAPNGDFVGFFPDKFNMWGKAAALQIRDVEIQSFDVDISDANLTTHVAVDGNQFPPVPGLGIDPNLITTTGIISIMQQDVMKLMLGLEPSQNYKFIGGDWMLQRFGLRPLVYKASNIWDHKWEFFYAFQLFQQKWTEQFVCQPVFTFLPELYPGMRVVLEDQNMAFYVEEVIHTFDRQNGFDTQATLSAPLRRVNGEWIILPLERAPQVVPTGAIT